MLESVGVLNVFQVVSYKNRTKEVYADPIEEMDVNHHLCMSISV